MNQDCKMNGQKIGNGLNGVNGPHDARKHIDTNGVNGTTKIFDSPLTPENLPAIKGGFSYIADLPKWNEDKPYYISGPLPADQEHLRTNLEYAAHTPTLYNLRGHEKHLKMERDGFELVYYPPEVRLSLDANAEDRTSEYLEATTSWLEKRFEAEKVLCYAFRYRKTGDEAEWEGSEHEIGTRVKPDNSTASPHVDQTLEGGLRRAKRHMTESEVKQYINDDWRIRIINVWRPLNRPVEDSPLAFCDYRTIEEVDLIAADRVSEQYAGEVYYLRHNPGQRWYWFEHHAPEEIAMFLSFDSKPNGPRFCAHASFKHQDATKDTPPRESIEVRSIVITKA